MKRLLIKLIISFLAIQMPAYAMWVSSSDFTTYDTESDKNNKGHKIHNRSIEVYFTDEWPHDKQMNFKQMNELDAKGLIIESFKTSKYVQLEFYGVKSVQHVKWIESLLEPLSFNYAHYDIYFHEGVDELTKENWEMKLLKAVQKN